MDRATHCLVTATTAMVFLLASSTSIAARADAKANHNPPPSVETSANVTPKQRSFARFVRAETLEGSRLIRSRLPALSRTERMMLGVGQLAPNRIIIPCMLQTENTYLRRYYKYKAVGTKAKVTCRMLVDRIELETWMEREWLAFWLPAHRGFFSKATAARRLEPTNVRVRCKGRESTKWRTLSYARVTYLGHDYFADVVSSERRIACGA